MKELLKYLNQNQTRYLKELFAFLGIPSISTDPEYKKDIKNCANFIAKELKKIGLNRVKEIREGGNPFIYGEWLGAKGKPTILAYGHYDVQPVDPLELWKTPPFEPSVRMGRIYARGAADNKGIIFAYLKAIEAGLKVKGTLPINLKVLIEGEEEIASPSSQKFLKKHQKLLQADAVLNSDFGGIRDDGIPVINIGARGLCAFEIKVTGSNRDLHSGLYGGAVVNPIFALIWLLSQLKDQKTGKILVPGFYNQVLPISKKEREYLKKVPVDEKYYKEKTGAPQLFGEKGFSVPERIGYRPTLEINGILGGYTGPGFKTVIPARATAKVSMRLVPNQDPSKIANLFKNYLKKICPKTINLEIKLAEWLANPWVISRDHHYLKIVAKSLDQVFNKYPIFIRGGGTIDIVSDFTEILKTPVLSLNFGGNNIHAPNENLKLNNFYRGIKTVIYFLEEFGKR